MGGRTKWMLAGLGLVALAGAYVYIGVDVRPHEEYVPDPVASVEDTLPAPPSAYGIPLDGFVIERGQVQRGQTFSDLLTPHGMNGARVEELVHLAAPVFDIHKLRAGRPFALIFTNDSARTPAY